MSHGIREWKKFVREGRLNRLSRMSQDMRSGFGEGDSMRVTSIMEALLKLEAWCIVREWEREYDEAKGVSVDTGPVSLRAHGHGDTLRARTGSINGTRTRKVQEARADSLIKLIRESNS
jgi:hypothetical protein